LLWDAHVKELWGHRRLSAITKQEIEKLHATLGAATPYQANRVLSLVKAIFNRAIDTEVYNANPAARVRAFEEQSRERFVGDDEISRFMKAVAEEPSETVRDFVLLALYTGQRRGNVQAMRWDDLNLELGTWTIPSTKTGRHTVPLTTEALAILRKRLKTRGEVEFVLPGRHGKGHLVDPTRQWREILVRAGMENLRIHDLRRTLGSWQAGTGSSLPVIGKTMGHKRAETTAIYARLQDKAVRDSMQTATDAITKASKPKAKRKAVKRG
jgi:integrase